MPKRKNPYIASLLAFIPVGVGYMYLHEWKRAAIFLAVVFSVMALTAIISPGVPGSESPFYPLWLLFLFFPVYDCYRLAKKSNARYGFDIKPVHVEPYANEKHEKTVTVTGYRLKCLNCNYTWDTKYAKIPARCPSCNRNIYNSDNYEVLNTYQFTSPCFIATAAYGTELNEEINILRYWRDRFLLKHYLGVKFVEIYYFVSPIIARAISKRDSIKFVIRLSLNPLINLLKRVYKIKFPQ